MTTNCLIQPQNSYNQRLFTTHAVGWAGIPHIENHDYSPVISAALAAPDLVQMQMKLNSLPLVLPVNSIKCGTSSD